MIELVAAGGLGFGLGVVTGMPLGVVNVAVAEAAAAGRTRAAIALGAGGALADAIHAALAFGGVGSVITRRPEWTRGLAIVATLAILIYAGVTVARRRPRPEARGPRSASPAVPGLLAGFLLTLPNPGALGAWVAVAAAVWPHVSLAGALVLAAGVGAGSALWFAVLARWVARSPRVAAASVRLALVALVAIAGLGLIRALR